PFSVSANSSMVRTPARAATRSSLASSRSISIARNSAITAGSSLLLRRFRASVLTSIGEFLCDRQHVAQDRDVGLLTELRVLDRGVDLLRPHLDRRIHVGLVLVERGLELLDLDSLRDELLLRLTRGLRLLALSLLRLPRAPRERVDEESLGIRDVGDTRPLEQEIVEALDAHEHFVEVQLLRQHERRAEQLAQ